MRLKQIFSFALECSYCYKTFKCPKAPQGLFETEEEPLKEAILSGWKLDEITGLIECVECREKHKKNMQLQE